MSVKLKHTTKEFVYQMRTELAREIAEARSEAALKKAAGIEESECFWNGYAAGVKSVSDVFESLLEETP